MSNTIIEQTYTAEIDGGTGGDTKIIADSAAEALVQAIAWARGGDWPDEGCEIEVSVVNNDDENDSDKVDIHILSLEEKLNQELDEADVLGEDEREWQTEQVIRIDGEYYFRRNNGGSRGAYDTRTTKNVLECRVISLSEARRMLLALGMAPAEVAEATA